MSNKKVSDRYAKAIFQLANETNQLDAVLADMETVKTAVEASRDLESLTLNPVVKYGKKQSIFSEIFKDNISKLSMDFILLLIKKGRDGVILNVSDRFIELYNVEKNRVPVAVTTAVEVDETTKNKVVEKLSAETGKTVIPSFKIDESIKGGVKVQIDDWVYDASIESQLREIHAKLIKGEN